MPLPQDPPPVPDPCDACSEPSPGGWWLFDSSPFTPRYKCGQWPDWLVGAWVAPSVWLFVLYLTVALLCVWLWREAKAAPFPRWPLGWIAAFFVGCGGGHLANALAFVWPAYRLAVLWDWYTAVASTAGVYGVWVLYRWGRGRLRGLAAERDRVVAERDAALAAVARERDAAVEQFHRTHRSKADLVVECRELKAELERMRERFSQQEREMLYHRLHKIQGKI